MDRRKIITWHTIKSITAVLIGTALFAAAVKWVYDPCRMVVGGFSGIAIIINELSARLSGIPVPLGLTTMVLNIPLFVVALPMKGKVFLLKTGAATALLSLWLVLLPEVDAAGRDLVLASVFGGVLSGTGIGLVLSSGATTGGTDMLASVLQRCVPFYSVAQIMLVLDGIIIIVGAFLFGIPSALYAIVSIYITSRISDAIVVGAHYARSVYVISRKPEEVATAVFEEIGRGVTGLTGCGMYTGEDKLVLFCVVSRKEIVRLKECVFRIDAQAFVIVSEAQEVHGEGFYHQIVQKNIG